MSDIKLSAGWPDNELLCPCCNGNNLHHGAVIQYSRREDEEAVRVTSIEGDEFNSSVVPNITSGNPSGRRGAIAIEFWCENCHGESDETTDIKPYFRLHIIQHKGTTFLDWDY